MSEETPTTQELQTERLVGDDPSEATEEAPPEAPKEFVVRMNRKRKLRGGLYLHALGRVINEGDKLSEEEYQEALKATDQSGLHYLHKEEA